MRCFFDFVCIELGDERVGFSGYSFVFRYMFDVIFVIKDVGFVF